MNSNSPYERGCIEARKDLNKSKSQSFIFEKLSLQQRLTLNTNKDTQFFILGYLEEFERLRSKFLASPAPQPFKPPIPKTIQKQITKANENLKNFLSENDYDLEL